MLKAAPYLLAAVLLLALVFAFLPGRGTRSDTGVALEGVELTLYPAQDPGAWWSFDAAAVQHDPFLGRPT
ncbi:hypothetical protein ACFP81_08555 [Deinococcus lacus]|uniref:Uncharacterized protein n=1 Tax=Deinococcus lacus TaxID=392561 RepID=A0ABW1YCJ7_9DEIO